MRSRLSARRKSFAFRVSRSSWGHSLQASSVRALLPRLAHTAGIEKRVHPYGLCPPVLPSWRWNAFLSTSFASSWAKPAGTRLCTSITSRLLSSRTSCAGGAGTSNSATAPSIRAAGGCRRAIAGAMDGCAGLCTQHSSRGDSRCRAGRGRRASSSLEEPPTAGRERKRDDVRCLYQER